MGIVRKSISFTEQQDTYIRSLIEKGFYTNDSEYVRDIVRKDQESRRNIIDLQDALLEGLESGVSSETIDSIWDEEIKAHDRRK
ncbi:MAG: type II toxin-antitoxin system ParD family antitoxin [Flavobacteriaceae bacterium]|nr:MAG: type II toxin-antitoxin system ParD family antitoxin [Flavobacteriaceae bacterium]